MNDDDSSNIISASWTTTSPSSYTGQSTDEIPRNVTHVRVDLFVKDIGMEAFQCCHHLVNVELNEGLERIGWSAFSGCTSLTSIRIPSTVREIGVGAFFRCSQLTNVEFNEGLERIYSWAFSWCTSLESITIPSTVREIGNVAFQGCSQLRNVEL